MPTKEDMIYEMLVDVQTEQRAFRKELREDMGDFRAEIREEVKKSCSTIERVEQRVGDAELAAARALGNYNLLNATLNNHAGDMALHYTPYFSETTWEKIRRKKVEIGVGGTTGTVISLVVYIFLKWMGIA